MGMKRKEEVNQNVLELARERISDAYDRYDHIAVMFSGGKDSTVCLNLTLDEARKRGRLPLDVIFYDEEAIPYQTEDYVRRVYNEEDVNLRWLCVPTVSNNACSISSPHWYQWAPEVVDKWVRPMPPEATMHLPYYNSDDIEERMPLGSLNGVLFYPYDEYGSVGVIMGIRAQESLTRTRAVLRRKEDNYIIKDRGNPWGGKKPPIKPINVDKVYPIYDWKTEDVWTAPKKFGWDYNRAYDAMEKEGISHLNQRVCPPFHNEAIRQLKIFKTSFPEIWDRLYKRVPGAATAARYGDTELYAYGKVQGPKKGESWQIYIKRLLDEFPPDKKKIMAEIISRWIKSHYNKTSEPILPWTAHWYTGISWKWLAQLAVRGDFKGRKVPPFSNQDLEKKQEKYYKALKEYKERGNE